MRLCGHFIPRCALIFVLIATLNAHGDQLEDCTGAFLTFIQKTEKLLVAARRGRWVDDADVQAMRKFISKPVRITWGQTFASTLDLPQISVSALVRVEGTSASISISNIQLGNVPSLSHSTHFNFVFAKTLFGVLLGARDLLEMYPEIMTLELSPSMVYNPMLWGLFESRGFNTVSTYDGPVPSKSYSVSLSRNDLLQLFSQAAPQ